MQFSTVISPDGVPYIQFDDWKTPDAEGTIIQHGFFTRNGGVSSGYYNSLNCGYGSQDAPANITENRRRVAASLGLGANRLYGLRQCHSADAVLVTSDQDAHQRPDADAHVTAIAEYGLAILTADCTPILFADRQAGVIGAAHAGWRGACGGVLEATVNRMCKAGATRDNITALIGPCIRQHSYQVGSDLRDEVLASTDEAVVFFATDQEPGKYRFDLAGYVAMRLESCGIGAIHDCLRDTYSESEQFFSHRFATHAGDSDSGRLISVIALQPFSTIMQEA
ncbi:peptidoglycan editing factor PgeF [Candidatus Puniceispirillum sp.]|uniref:peptidoglycan editing factor PgeF n=1 Tax=Candidatus Puniceispirillum sp. TaxID=2026719 RepID=UPI003F6A3CD4